MHLQIVEMSPSKISYLRIHTYTLSQCLPRARAYTHTQFWDFLSYKSSTPFTRSNRILIPGCFSTWDAGKEKTGLDSRFFCARDLVIASRSTISIPPTRTRFFVAAGEACVGSGVALDRSSRQIIRRCVSGRPCTQFSRLLSSRTQASPAAT